MDARAARSDEPATVTVVGVGTARAVPDAARLVLGVEAVEAAPAAALGTTSAALAAMLSALRGAGVADHAVRSGGLTVEPDWSRGDVPTGYRAASTMIVDLDGLDAAGRVAATALSAGGTHARVHHLGLSVRDPGAAESRARDEAFGHARAAAAQYAVHAGHELGAVRLIEEGGAGGGAPRRHSAARAAAAGGELAVPAGELEVTVVVTVSWGLR